MSSRRKKRLKWFFITPIIYCLVTFVLIFTASLPYLSDIISIANMFVSDNQVDYSHTYENIFVPTTEDGETVNADDVVFPGVNNQFGELKIDGRDVETKLFYGDGSVPLRNGVGIYAGSFIPGYGKTILVAGHNNTYFNGLKNVKIGDIVKIKTSYGNYEYKIIKTKIAGDKDKKAYNLSSQSEQLVMYTCYPFDELGLTSKRYFVYAEKISGPQIVGLYE